MDTAVVALSRECTYLDAYALLQRAARADARADVGADARADAQGDARGGPGDEIPVVESQASPLLIASPSPSPNPSPSPTQVRRELRVRQAFEEGVIDETERFTLKTTIGRREPG